MQRNNLFISFLIMFIVLVLLQVLVFNRISILGYATPYLYIFLIIKLPIKINRNFSLLLACILGFTIDVFCNTPGINAAATTLAAFVRHPLQASFFTHDDYISHQVPQASNYGMMTYVKYAVSMIFIHHAALILLESFSYFNLILVIQRIVLSTILTSILIVGLDGFSVSKKKDRGKE